MISTKHTGSDVEALAALAAAARYTDIDEAPEDLRDELIASTDARLACSEVETELLGRGGQRDSYNGTDRLTWHPAAGAVAVFDARLDVMSVCPERTRGRIRSMSMSTTTMTAREVVETAARMAEQIEEEMA